MSEPEVEGSSQCDGWRETIQLGASQLAVQPPDADKGNPNSRGCLQTCLKKYTINLNNTLMLKLINGRHTGLIVPGLVSSLLFRFSYTVLSISSFILHCMVEVETRPSHWVLTFPVLRRLLNRNAAGKHYW